MSWRRHNIMTYAKQQADAPNGFSFAKMRKAATKRLRFFCSTPQFRARLRFEQYQMSAHNAMMTMVRHNTPATITLPFGVMPKNITTKTWWEGNRHYTEIRDLEGHLIKREYKDFQ